MAANERLVRARADERPCGFPLEQPGHRRHYRDFVRGPFGADPRIVIPVLGTFENLSRNA
jgi:hypothetical protein